MNELTKFNSAWKQFCEFYEKHGSYKEKGYRQTEKASYLGRYFWSEQDVVFHLSRFLQEEFGEGWIHNELSVAKHTFKNFGEKEKERRERIDIVVSNPDNYDENWRNCHDIFIEVKQITRGMIFNDAPKKMKGAIKDCKKLVRQCRSNRCRYAVVCIVNDDHEKLRLDERTVSQLESRYKPVKILPWQSSS